MRAGANCKGSVDISLYWVKNVNCTNWGKILNRRGAGSAEKESNKQLFSFVLYGLGEALSTRYHRRKGANSLPNNRTPMETVLHSHSGRE